MKKHFIILICVVAFMQITVKGQPTDKPMNNFTVDQENRIMRYERVFSDSLDDTKAIVRKLSRYLLSASGVYDTKFDSTGIFTGKIKNIHPAYYGSGSSKNLTGSFTIEIKNGKYRLTVKDMIWQSGNVQPGTVVVGYYGYGYAGSETLESTCLNHKGTKWEPIAFNILPDIDDAFKKIFTIPADSNSGW